MATSRPRRRAVLMGGGVVAVLAGLYGVGYAMTGDTLPRNATVQGVAIGGMTVDAAVAKLETDLATSAVASLTIHAGGESVTRTPAELGLSVDYRASVLQAGGVKSWDPRRIWAQVTGGGAHDAVVNQDVARTTEEIKVLAGLADREASNAVIVLDGTKASVKESVDGIKVDVDAATATVKDRYLDATRIDADATVTAPDITTDEAREAVTTVVTPALSAPVKLTVSGKKLDITPAMIAAALTFETKDSKVAVSLDGAVLNDQLRPAMAKLGFNTPKDASFTFVNGRPKVVPSQPGIGIEPTKLVETVSAAMVKTSDRSGEATVVQQEASFTTAQAEAMGIKEVTGEFTTYFPATAYRITNIGKSAGLVNGVFLKPGDVFSMNKVLGPRTLARGWAAGGAIDGGKVVERMGGGISQTTTTTFNAIFFAGLEDIYHKPHSLYFSRYPMGREATLDWVSVDMKFRNNTKYGVLMQAYTNNPPVGGKGSITVKVWSTKVYDVKASAPVRSNIRQPGPTIQDNSAVCTPQSAMSGFTVTYNRLFYQNGKLVKTEPFKWTCNSLQPRVCTNPNAKRDRIER